jgi:hypothetical protein
MKRGRMAENKPIYLRVGDYAPSIITDIEGYFPYLSQIISASKAEDLTTPESEPRALIVTDQYRLDGYIVRTFWEKEVDYKDIHDEKQAV